MSAYDIHAHAVRSLHKALRAGGKIGLRLWRPMLRGDLVLPVARRF